MEDAGPGFNLPIDITYAPPRWLAVSVAALHAGALICLLATGLPWYLKLSLVLPILGSLVYQLGRHYLSILDGPVRLILDTRDHWQLIDPDSRSCPARLDSASIITPALVVLCLKTGDKRRHDFILTAGNTDADTLRRLRVRLYHPKGAD